MGKDVKQEDFSPSEYREFSQRVCRQLGEFKALLKRPRFGEGDTTIGAELEFYIISNSGVPLPCNQALRNQSERHEGGLDGGGSLQLELNQFNLEYNLPVKPLAGRPFTALKHSIEKRLRLLNRDAMILGGRVIAIGILPTLKEEHLQAKYMTDIARYRALSKSLKRQKGGPFRVHIDGDDPIKLLCNDVTLEGANTSFQVHLRVSPEKFAATYNAAQLVTPIALGVATNSPILLGHKLWEETRIALFKQSIDSRAEHRGRDRSGLFEPPRVHFGHGWLRKGAFELFSEAVAHFPPLLPILSEPETFAEISRQEGDVPSLSELRLHMGSTWPWNRVIYDPSDGGHLRIEMRALPAGPTPVDMVANMAFLIGMIQNVADNIDHYIEGLTFHCAERNFYRTAKYGFDAELAWLDRSTGRLAARRLTSLAEQMIPVAEKGLCASGVEPDEVQRYLKVIEQRVECQMTGARWQNRVLSQSGSDGAACRFKRMLNSYCDRADSGLPVAQWAM